MKATKEIINQLQQDILKWQGFQSKAEGATEMIGLGAIESAFPNGVFPKKAIHEFISVAPEHAAASDGFIAGLLSVLMQEGAACVWISTGRKLFPSALNLFNVHPERIIFMDVSYEKDVLWAMEEALKCEGLGAVVAELHNLSLIESRRLQLAVEKTGVTGFVLRKDARKLVSSVATARWRITPAPSEVEEEMPGVGFPRWNVELTRVRNGNPGSWVLEWNGDCFMEVGQLKKDTAWLDEMGRQIG